MSAPSNPQAFPCEQHETLDGSWNQTFEPGMTLRDWFAGQAISAIISITSAGQHQPTRLPTDKIGYHEAMARDAYVMADAMLAARGDA